MKICEWGKDGGPDSVVDAFYIIEAKSLFTVAVLRFGHGSRDAYHSHAFDCWNWLIKGSITEIFEPTNPEPSRKIFRGLAPWKVYIETMHKVWSDGTSWVFTIRGPWVKTWEEIKGDERYTLGHGRTRT